MATSSPIRMSQDGKTLSGRDKAVVIFNAPDVTQNTQYVVNLTVSDGTLSSTAVYTLNVKAKAAAADDEDKTTSYPAGAAARNGIRATSSTVMAHCTSANRSRKAHGVMLRLPTMSPA